MGQQSNKVQKRRRRLEYNKRKKIVAKTNATTKPAAAKAASAPAKKAAAKPAAEKPKAAAETAVAVPSEA